MNPKGIKHKKGRETLFFTTVLLYVFAILLFIFFIKSYARDYTIKKIDESLLKTAKMIPHVLPEDYHDRAINKNSISNAEYQKIEKKLTDIAFFTGMRYIWTDIRIGNKYYLTSCNRTEQTDIEGLKIFYFMPYEEGVSAQESLAFDSDKPVFANFNDKWGNFRAVFIPMTSPKGNKYLACAEYTLDYVDETVKKATLFSSLIALFFFLAFIPVFMSYVYNSKKRAQELLEINESIRKSEENLKTVLNSIADGVIVVDENSKIIRMNPVAEELTGWKFEEASQVTLSDIFCVKDYDTGACVDNILEKIIHEKHTGTYNSYLVLKSKNGEEKIIAENGSPLFNKEKKYIGSLIVFRDITDKERLEEELRQSQKLESVGQLAGGIAHDFNNMLAAILGSAELLESHLKENEELKQYLDIIIKGSTKASELTRKLLAFSRKGKKKNEPFDMHECIKSAITLLSRSIDRKINIETSLNAEYSFVMGDPILFENVILNIGINSRDAMPNGGTFKVTTTNVEYDEEFCRLSHFDIKPGKFIKMKLSDTGTGIPKSILNKVFDPFFTTKKAGKGTGLGLSVVYGTVKDHNGFISIKSEEGKGTEITIAIPSIISTNTKKEVQAPSIYKGSGNILVVDDEILIRDTLENILKSMSYNVITASNGEEGIDILKNNSNNIDAVFLDLIMPVMDGRETLLKMKAIAPHIPIIMISGFTTVNTIKEIMEKGAYDFLQKPYKKNDVIKILMELENQKNNLNKE